MRTLSWRGGLMPALAALCITAACSKNEPAPAPASDAPQYEPAATVKDLMQSIVDPSADVVWNAVTTVQPIREGRARDESGRFESISTPGGILLTKSAIRRR